MLKIILNKLENPKRPFLGPNVKALEFWGLLLPDKTWKKHFYILMHTLVTLFIISALADIWFVKSDINLLLCNLKIIIPATVSLVKAMTFLYWQKYWKSVIEYVTKADLYQRSVSDENKIQLINAFTQYCRKITYLYWILIYTTDVFFIFHPVFDYLTQENVQNTTSVYKPVISSWVPFDKNTVHGYFVASFYQSYATIYGGGWITGFDMNAVVVMVFFKAELQLIRKHCAEIFGSEMSTVDDTEALKRLKDCHRRYVDLVKYARLFNSCLSPVMLFYMFVCSITLCLTVYQMTIETDLMQRFVLAEYLVFGVAQLFIFCWHSNDVLIASQDTMRGPYESIWWAKGAKHRKDLYILTAQMRSQVVFTAGPFMDLTVPTFIRILKGAYSYYTLLINSQIE